MHCLTPKYQNIGSASKNIPLKLESDVSSNSSSSIEYLYYKKKAETYYDEYKLVYSIKRPSKMVYIYLHFISNRASSNLVTFQTFLTVSKTNILSQVVNETDFSLNGRIDCGNLKNAYTGQKIYQSSFFSAAGLLSNGGFQGGYNPGAAPVWGQNSFGQQTYPYPNQNQNQNQNFGGFGMQQPSYNGRNGNMGYAGNFGQTGFNSAPYFGSQPAPPVQSFGSPSYQGNTIFV